MSNVTDQDVGPPAIVAAVNRYRHYCGSFCGIAAAGILLVVGCLAMLFGLKSRHCIQPEVNGFETFDVEKGYPKPTGKGNTCVTGNMEGTVHDTTHNEVAAGEVINEGYTQRNVSVQMTRRDMNVPGDEKATDAVSSDGGTSHEEVTDAGLLQEEQNELLGEEASKKLEEETAKIDVSSDLAEYHHECVAKKLIDDKLLDEINRVLEEENAKVNVSFDIAEANHQRAVETSMKTYNPAQVGGQVEVIKEFISNDKTKTTLTKGLHGTILRVKDSGNALIDFGFRQVKYVKTKNFDKLKFSQPKVFKKGERVRVVKEFISDDVDHRVFKTGLEGTIMEVDDEEDAWIDFGLISKRSSKAGLNCVFKESLSNIEALPAQFEVEQGRLGTKEC